jgi:hypothetical protein
MTLSHCWGKAKILKLENETFEDFMKEIPFDQLSKTFREAITLTRTMGIQYIWIDSLCIIQNSTEDWKEQSATMGEVYSNSFCNVAATGAIDGRGGCFVDRNPAFVRSLTLQLPDLGTRNARLKEKPREASDDSRPKTDWEFLRSNIPDQGGEYTLLDVDLWRTEVEYSALCSRAWVLQERVLAPKTIHFGERQVFFECMQSQACEMFPDQIPTLLQQYGTFKNSISIATHNLPSPFKDLEPSTQWTEYKHMWERIVNAYSKCDLTFGSDKLVAISGLARRFKACVQAEYVGGMWLTHFLEQLLWETEGPKEIRRPDKYQAPSWSWASVNGPVGGVIDKQLRGGTPSIETVRIGAWPPGEDMFGGLSYGVLQIRGQLLEGWIERDTVAYALQRDICAALENCSKRRYTPPICSWRTNVFSDFEQYPSTIAGKDEKSLKTTTAGDKEGFYIRHDQPREFTKGCRIFCCPIFRDDYSCRGLVLVPTGSIFRGEFRRIGVFEMNAIASPGASEEECSRMRDLAMQFAKYAIDSGVGSTRHDWDSHVGPKVTYIETGTLPFRHCGSYIFNIV